MAYENFSTGWTETDPNGRLSQSATRSTWTALTRNEDAYLSKNAGVSFSGNWDIAFDFYVDSASSNNFSLDCLWLTEDSAGGTSVKLGDYNGTKIYIALDNLELSGYTDERSEDYTTLNVNTLYYARFRRNEAVGTNGTLYLDVYASASNRNDGVSVLLSLSLTITKFGKLDMTIFQCPTTFVGGNTDVLTGYIENLDLYYHSSPTGQNSVLDTFDRANEGPPMTGWSDAVNGLKVISQTVAGGTASASNISQFGTTLYGADIEIYITVTAVGSTSDYITLYGSDGTGDGYTLNVVKIAGAGNDTFELQRLDGFVQTTLGATIIQEVSNGDSIGFSVVGSTLTAYYKASGGSWASIGTRTDTAYSNTKNFYLNIYGTTARCDDFGGGTVVSGGWVSGGKLKNII